MSLPASKTNSTNADACSQDQLGQCKGATGEPDQQWFDEIDRCYRAGTCRAYARHVATKSGLDAEDLLHRAIERALYRGSRGLSAKDRINECIQSLASTDARAASRARTNGRLGSIDPATVADVIPGTELLRPDIALARIAAGRTAVAILEEAAGGDPTQAALIDCLGDDLRGEDITQALGIDQTELATRRRRLKRTVGKLCRPYVTSRELDFSPRLVGKAAWAEDSDGQNLTPKGFIC